jgi:hypothetical protein
MMPNLRIPPGGKVTLELGLESGELQPTDIGHGFQDPLGGLARLVEINQSFQWLARTGCGTVPYCNSREQST